MNVKEKLQDTKPKIERAKRRLSAVVAHGKGVVDVGLDVLQSTGSVAARSAKSILAAQKQALTDKDGGVAARLKKTGAVTATGTSKAYGEILKNLKDGYQTVADKAARVPQMTHKEKAEENKIDRKLKKAKKTALRAQAEQ